MASVIAKREKTFDQGELIRVPVPGKPGQSIKLTRAEAEARGLLPASAGGVETKERKPTRNKSRRQVTVKKEASDG